MPMTLKFKGAGEQPNKILLQIEFFTINFIFFHIQKFFLLYVFKINFLCHQNAFIGDKELQLDRPKGPIIQTLSPFIQRKRKQKNRIK